MTEWDDDLQYEFEEWVEGRYSNYILTSLSLIGMPLGLILFFFDVQWGSVLVIIGMLSGMCMPDLIQSQREEFINQQKENNNGRE